MRSRRLGWTLAFTLGLGLPAVPRTSPDWTLESALRQLDIEARSFRSLTAAVERTKVTVVVNDRSTESGEIAVRQDGKMRLDLTEPDPRTILRAGDNLYVFRARIKRLEEYNLGRHRELVDQFLLLGFGTPGRALKKGYLITLLGEQKLENKKVLLLELTPKSEKVRNQIAKVHLWVDEATWLPVQQKFFETGTEDYFILRYSHIVRNAEIPDARFKPHWPKGTVKVKP